ncbi:3065_t:CDS:2 [Ambispora leptoticha]|uniref:3065_t:CDS:1 n=1 Tax=Ambispora leptoticha TaxID=144679 RepID=A0A9N9BAZ3_9GLOM|nr:3065_t:CDS:2 [Ambispora leptoticha]
MEFAHTGYCIKSRFKNDLVRTEKRVEFMASPQFTHENNNFYTFIFPKNHSSLSSSKVSNENNNSIAATVTTTTTHFAQHVLASLQELRIKEGLWIAYVNTVNEQQEVDVEIRHCKFSKKILLSLVDIIDQLYGAVGMLGVSADEE